MPGRRPKPVDLRMLQGNPGGRAIMRTTNTFEAGAPAKPSWLDEEASAEWDRLVQQLADESGVLSPAHGGILLVACEHFSQFRKASRFLVEHGETYETGGESGRMVREYPQVRQRQEALKGYRAALNDLGATPTQAPRVHRLPSEQTELPGIHKLLG